MGDSKVSRVVHLLLELQSGQRYSADDLAKMLNKSRRTIFRDLNELKKAGVPYNYNQEKHYYTIDPNFYLPPINLSNQETLGLLLLVHLAKNHLHLPFKISALRAILKIENILPDEIKRYCNAALQNISIKTDPPERGDLLDAPFAQLLDASLKKRIMKIRYYLPHERKSIITDLSPYHFLYNDHAWHVIGKSTLHKGIHAFKLNQIKEISTSDKCFAENSKFDIFEYLNRAWAITPEGSLYHVKLKFSPEIAHSVAEVQWHNTQTVTFEEDGSAIVEFRVNGVNEIMWWVLSYGNRVQILSPAILRQKIIEIAKDSVKQNETLIGLNNR